MDMVDMEKVALVVVLVVVVIGLVGLMVAGGVLMVGTAEVNLVVMEDMVLVVEWHLTGKIPTLDTQVVMEEALAEVMI